MKRIAIGGFQHETNTFSDKPADFQTFVDADGWPGLTRGPELVDCLKGYNIGVTGLIEGAQIHGWEIIPITWAYGGAGGKVTENAFERISKMLLEDLTNAGPVDGLLLDLHGAMVAEHIDDGEGELLRRVRSKVSPNVPIVCCLDLHANVSAEMMTLADRLVIYRTYPHLDMAATGVLAAHELAKIFAGDPTVPKAFRQLPFLIPLTVGCTMLDPAKWLYERAAEFENQPGISHVSFACGFNPSDVEHCGPSLLVYGENQNLVCRIADQFFDEILMREPEFAAKYWNVEDAVSQAIRKAPKVQRPIILADVQDNYGGGSYSDTNWILAELVKQRAQNAAIGVLCDPEVALAAHQAGEGAEIRIGLGAKSAQDGHQPFDATYRVEALSDGNIQSTGTYFAGGLMQLGHMALLSLDGVKVVVSSKAEQAADQTMFTHFGIDPSALDILSLKSTVHYRADFQALASDILEVVAPAPMKVDSRELSYKNLRPGMRITPRSRP